MSELHINSTQQQAVKNKSKKKSKKGAPKPLTKRVIITDADLSMTCEETQTPVKKIVKKLDNLKNNDNKIEEKAGVMPIIKTEEDNIKQDLPKSSEDEEKKKNKKKKKTSKITAPSNSDATVNAVDDSYDFLLDLALADVTVEKTNVEISQELDKIIQKGMYSSLEEKIKSLNIDESDGFFKSVFSKISSRESSEEKTGFSKTPDFSKILQNTRTLFKPNSLQMEYF